MNRFVKDLAIYAPSQFLPALTAFVTTPILTRLLAPAEYGYWAQASSVAAFLVALAVSGMGSAALRFYPTYEAKSTVAVFYATISVSIAAVVTVVAALSFLGLFLLKESLPPWVVQLLPLVILIFVANSIATVFIAVIRAQGRSGLYTAFQLLTNYGGLGIGLLLVAVFGFRVEGLLLGTLLALVPALPFLVVFATRKVGIHPGDFKLADALEIWRYAWPLALGSVAMWGLRVSDLFIIGSFWPARDVGLYSVSYSISAKSDRAPSNALSARRGTLGLQDMGNGGPGGHRSDPDNGHARVPDRVPAGRGGAKCSRLSFCGVAHSPGLLRRISNRWIRSILQLYLGTGEHRHDGLDNKATSTSPWSE